MQFHELPGQGEAQAGSLEPLGIDRLQLGEGLEQLGDVFLPDADAGVRNGDLDEIPVKDRTYLHGAGGRGELDGIGEQVEQDLLQFPLVGRQADLGLRRDLQRQLDAALDRLLPQHAHGAFQGFPQREAAQVELHLARLHLGEVQDVVDQGEQVPAAGKDVVDVFLLLFVDDAEHLVLQHLGEADHRIERGAQLVAHVGQEVGLDQVGLFGHDPGVFKLHVLFLQHLVQTFALGDVAGGGEHPLQLSVAVVEGGGVVGDHGLLAVPGAYGEFVVGELPLPQNQLDGRLGPLGIGEVVLERRADQLVAGAVRQYFHLLVDVRDDAGRVGGHAGVDVRLEQGAGVELVVAQALAQLHLLRLDLLSDRVVGADQKIADDGVLRVPERRDGDHGREAAAVLSDVGELVDVLDAARRLEDQGLETRGDRGPQFGAERLGAGDDFQRIGDVRRRDPVHDLGCRVAQHALGADVEYLDHPFGVGGDAGEVGRVEYGILERPRLEQRLFGMPARGDVLHGDQDDVRAYILPEDLPGVQEDDLSADAGENMVHLVAVEDGFIGEDVLEQHPQFGDVPLPVAEVVDEIADGLLGRYLEGFVETEIGREDFQLRVQHHQRLAHGLDDALGILQGLLDLRLQLFGDRAVHDGGKDVAVL